MLFTIRWSPKAWISYLKILEDIDRSPDNEKVREFDQETTQKLERIQRFPFSCQYSQESDMHKCVLTDHKVLYYRVNQTDKAIELKLFRDSRQDPDTLNL